MLANRLVYPTLRDVFCRSHCRMPFELGRLYLASSVNVCTNQTSWLRIDLSLQAIPNELRARLCWFLFLLIFLQGASMWLHPTFGSGDAMSVCHCSQEFWMNFLDNRPTCCSPYTKTRDSGALHTRIVSSTFHHRYSRHAEVRRVVWWVRTRGSVLTTERRFKCAVCLCISCAQWQIQRFQNYHRLLSIKLINCNVVLIIAISWHNQVRCRMIPYLNDCIPMQLRNSLKAT